MADSEYISRPTVQETDSIRSILKSHRGGEITFLCIVFFVFCFAYLLVWFVQMNMGESYARDTPLKKHHLCEVFVVRLLSLTSMEHKETQSVQNIRYETVESHSDKAGPCKRQSEHSGGKPW